LEKISKQAANSNGLILAVSAAAFIIAVLMGVSISRSISAPINTIVMVLGMLAKGDMNFHRVLTEKDKRHNKRKDEIGILARATDSVAACINEQVQKIQKLADGDLSVEIDIRSEEDVLGIGLTKMIDQFNDLVSSIMTAANQVASGSGLVSDSSTALSQGATEQAGAIQQLTTSIEEVAAQTNRNAENAGKVDEISRSAKANAAGGNAYMKDMLAAMDDINESSGKINKIIKVIDDIAFQTNILALNAAVEAARAGQNGKGFAVVAEEVRTLAAKSADAVKETTDLIETSIRKVDVGTRIANDTAEALTKIVTEVERVAELVSTIASASQEQAASIKQINMGVSQVSQVVQTNAATAEESAAASEELTSQAEQLMQTVSMFKIKDNVTRQLLSSRRR
jgi:methyl-accepting chemotaxis protein